MARIAGVDIPNEKRLDISLRYIYGIGATMANPAVAVDLDQSLDVLAHVATEVTFDHELLLQQLADAR